MRAMRQLWRLRQDEDGATLVELAFVISLFLLLFFMLLDFGRLSYNWVMAEKAVQMAARMAAVRPAVCANLPTTNLPGAGNSARFGLPCSGSAICQGEVVPQTIACQGDASATGGQIFASVAGLLPGNATPANLRFSYTYDAGMNFLGGPYVPVVTVEIPNNGDADCADPGELCFRFASPLAGLARLSGVSAASTATQQAREQNGIPFPSMSVSLPGEDLALGDAG